MKNVAFILLKFSIIFLFFEISIARRSEDGIKGVKTIESFTNNVRKINNNKDFSQSNSLNKDKSIEQSILEYIQHTKSLDTPLVVEMEDKEGRPIAPSDSGLWMALRAIRPLMFEQMLLKEQYWKIDYVAAAHQLNVLEEATSPHDTMYQTTFVLSRKPFRTQEEYQEKTFIRPNTAVVTDQFHTRTCYANILYQYNLHVYQYWALQCYQ